MITCFKCGKILSGTLHLGEYVMCKECEEKWTSVKSTIDKDSLEGMVNELMKLKPFGWVFIPKMEDAVTISVDNKPIVLCQDCKHKPKRFEGSAVGGFALNFPDTVCPCQCVDDGYYSWEPSEVWFCANGEKEEEDAAER